MSLDGRAALITGGGRGIGLATARALAAAGAEVVISARTAGEIEAAAKELRTTGHRAHAAVCDVTDREAVRTLARRCADLVGSVAILVNNAGAARSAPFDRITPDEWDHMLAINATAAFHCAQALLPPMIAASWGRIVNVASVAGLTGAPYIAAYTASKHALVGLTRALAAEVAKQGVTVNAVCPGYVDTAMTEQSVQRIVEKTGRTKAQALEAILQRSPQRRLIQPDEVAHAVLSLCHEQAGSVNGQAIVIDGGELLA